MPESTKTHDLRGEVVAVGPGNEVIDEHGQPHIIPCKCKVGDIAVFHSNVGTEVLSGGEKYIILPDTAVMAVELSE